MARNPTARRLTETHRQAQIRLGVATADQVRRLARSLIDPRDLRRTVPLWLESVLPLLNIRREDSAILARNYVQTYRVLELGTIGSLDVPLADAIEEAATRVSVTAPMVKMITQGQARHGLARATQLAFNTAAGEAMKHVLNGARNTVTNAATLDREALGWSRATDGAPCAFCAMLAGRGAVYKGEETADFQPHGLCGCQPEIVYDTDAPRPAEAFEDLWYESTGGYSGKKAVNAFRRAYERPALHGVEPVTAE